MTQTQEILIEDIKVGRHEQRLELYEEGVEQLAASIARVGLIYPIVLAADGDKYILIEGHRRLAAYKKLGRERIPGKVMRTEEKISAEIAFAGNFFRQDLSPIELAAAIKDCAQRGSMSIEEMAAGFHRSVHWVNQMMAIAEWPADVQKAVHCDGLSVSAASNLALVTDDSYRGFLVRSGIEGGATARTTAAWLQAWRAMQPPEEAITAEPVAGELHAAPMVPQAPCLCCSQLFEVNMMSHVPVCGGCIQVIRTIGQTQV